MIMSWTCALTAFLLMYPRCRTFTPAYEPESESWSAIDGKNPKGPMYRVNDFDQIQVSTTPFGAELHFVQLGSHGGNQLLQGDETEPNGALVSAHTASNERG